MHLILVCFQIAPVAPQCLDQLSKLLLTVCKNPTVPGFNHFLFESVAALIANTAAGNKKTVETLESMLFPAFQTVLSEDVQVNYGLPPGGDQESVQEVVSVLQSSF